jgi:hypothetical protein
VFQRQYSCGPPPSRELTREKHERLFIVVMPTLSWAAKLLIFFAAVSPLEWIGMVWSRPRL